MSSNYLFRLKKPRTIWLNIHLYLGLILGFLFTLFGITGSLLVFHSEIDQWLNPKLLNAAVQDSSTPYQTFESLLKTAQSALPIDAQITGVTYPYSPETAVTVNYTHTNLNKIKEKWQLAINPYTAAINGKRLLSSDESILPKTFIRFIYKLHYDLLLDAEVSPPIVGIIAGLLIISVLSGLILWWPLIGRWRQAFSFKTNSSKQRLNYDLHKTAGYSSALLLILLLLSGIYMVIPEKVIPFIELFSPTSYCFWIKSKPPSTVMPPIGMEAAVSIALQHYPTGSLHWVFGANSADSAYVICQDGVKTAKSFLQHRCLVMDRYTGNILDDDDPTKGTAGEILAEWQWPLHSGTAFGLPGRLLVFISGLACPVLFITGLVRWLQKQQAKLKRVR
ncbi:MAG: PepSY-associated TM helix domain-containing protein [Methylococcales bacterium]